MEGVVLTCRPLPTLCAPRLSPHGHPRPPAGGAAALCWLPAPSVPPSALLSEGRKLGSAVVSLLLGLAESAFPPLPFVCAPAPIHLSQTLVSVPGSSASGPSPSVAAQCPGDPRLAFLPQPSPTLCGEQSVCVLVYCERPGTCVLKQSF